MDGQSTESNSAPIQMKYRQGHTRVAVRRGPTRLQVVLAAAWMILSLAIGGVISAQASDERAASPDSVSGIAH